jgi:hypothetical protein
MTRRRIVDALYVLGVVASLFVASAFVAGLWVGLVLRYVWILAP